MRKMHSSQDHSELPLPCKLSQNLLPKKTHKQFQLLYRQRDQSAEENPIESIIFVKSKTCKPTSNDKKIKVHEEFKKIMHDLNVHVNQHKKTNKSQKKCTSTASTQLKTTFSTKKSTNQPQINPKKQKLHQSNHTKVLKTVNKANLTLQKQKSPIIEAVKSPKKNNKSHLSPKSKQILSPKTHKFEKENLQTKRVNISQKLQRKKSPQQKTNRKPNLSEFQQDTTIKKSKFNPFGLPFNQASQIQGKTQIKRNIRSIPLKVEEYILIEDNFERIKKKSLCRLQTKLLSTHRNNCKEFENKLSLKQNQDEVDIFFEKINRQCFEQSDPNFIERSSFNSKSNRSEGQINKPAIAEEHQNEQIQEIQAQKQIIAKIVLIQKWWRRMLKIEAIELYLFENLQKSQNFKGQQKPEPERNFTTPVNFPSAKSLSFNDEIGYNEGEDNLKSNEEMSMLKNQNEIVTQKKLLHEKILRNLLNQKKISKHDFENKMALVQTEYEKELKDIMTLYKLIEFGARSEENIEQGVDGGEIKIIQGPKNLDKSELFGEGSAKKTATRSTPQNESEQDEIPLKIYKIGDKITPQMKNYIEESKKSKQKTQNLSKEQSQKQKDLSQNDFISEKYSKKTNELGEQYFQDFESDSSNDQSPHKMLSASNFEEFESQISPESHGTSFEPNAHFIKMLEQYKENELIKEKIEQRVAVQMGVTKVETESRFTVNTSILGIHQFLVNFFKFYLHYYKDEFLRFVNMPYGYQPEQRLKFIQGYEDMSDDLSEDSDGIIYGLEYIISDDVFDQFVDQYYATAMQSGNQQQKAMVECAKIHDRALFECFNEALNNFRPYYSISGPPYVWNCSEKTLTFYFIAEQNINEVFQKTQYRLMKWASGLLGLYADGYDSRSGKHIPNEQQTSYLSIQDILAENHANCHPLVFEKREENLVKEERIELIETMARWGDNEEQRTSALYELSSLILEELGNQMVIQFLSKSNQLL